MHWSSVRISNGSAVILPTLMILSALPVFARNAGAQGTITGAVRDSTGVGINGAKVSVNGVALAAESDDSGAFILRGVPPGPASIHVRRLGFSPASAQVVVTSRATAHVDVRVREVAHELNPVVVYAKRPRHYEGYLAGFYQRRDLGFGRFITGDEIAKRAPLRVTDMLRMVPGLQVTESNPIESHVRIRGNRCWPSVWIDGAPANAAEFDLDWVTPSDIAGIEIYSSIATVPPEFVDPLGPRLCGTIVVWTRQGEPRKKKPISAAQLADLVTSLKVYTADQVDTPARADSSTPARPLYPDSFYKEHVPGRVLAEFVVDTAGRPEPETVGIVSSTDPLFAASVVRALSDARFVPAQLGGHPVRQIVQQPFTFVVPEL
jgi:TonB family protein